MPSGREMKKKHELTLSQLRREHERLAKAAQERNEEKVSKKLKRKTPTQSKRKADLIPHWKNQSDENKAYPAGAGSKAVNALKSNSQESLARVGSLGSLTQEQGGEVPRNSSETKRALLQKKRVANLRSTRADQVRLRDIYGSVESKSESKRNRPLSATRRANNNNEGRSESPRSITRQKARPASAQPQSGKRGVNASTPRREGVNEKARKKKSSEEWSIREQARAEARQAMAEERRLREQEKIQRKIEENKLYKMQMEERRQEARGERRTGNTKHEEGPSGNAPVWSKTSALAWSPKPHQDVEGLVGRMPYSWLKNTSVLVKEDGESENSLVSPSGAKRPPWTDNQRESKESPRSTKLKNRPSMAQSQFAKARIIKMEERKPASPARSVGKTSPRPMQWIPSSPATSSPRGPERLTYEAPPSISKKWPLLEDESFLNHVDVPLLEKVSNLEGIKSPAKSSRVSVGYSPRTLSQTPGNEKLHWSPYGSPTRTLPHKEVVEVPPSAKNAVKENWDALEDDFRLVSLEIDAISQLWGVKLRLSLEEVCSLVDALKGQQLGACGVESLDTIGRFQPIEEIRNELRCAIEECELSVGEIRLAWKQHRQEKVSYRMCSWKDLSKYAKLEAAKNAPLLYSLLREGSTYVDIHAVYIASLILSGLNSDQVIRFAFRMLSSGDRLGRDACRKLLSGLFLAGVIRRSDEPLVLEPVPTSFSSPRDSKESNCDTHVAGQSTNEIRKIGAQCTEECQVEWQEPNIYSPEQEQLLDVQQDHEKKLEAQEKQTDDDLERQQHQGATSIVGNDSSLERKDSTDEEVTCSSSPHEVANQSLIAPSHVRESDEKNDMAAKQESQVELRMELPPDLKPPPLLKPPSSARKILTDEAEQESAEASSNHDIQAQSIVEQQKQNSGELEIQDQRIMDGNDSLDETTHDSLDETTHVPSTTSEQRDEDDKALSDLKTCLQTQLHCLETLDMMEISKHFEILRDTLPSEEQAVVEQEEKQNVDVYEDEGTEAEPVPSPTKPGKREVRPEVDADSLEAYSTKISQEMDDLRREICSKYSFSYEDFIEQEYYAMFQKPTEDKQQPQREPTEEDKRQPQQPAKEDKPQPLPSEETKHQESEAKPSRLEEKNSIVDTQKDQEGQVEQPSIQEEKESEGNPFAESSASATGATVSEHRALWTPFSPTKPSQ